MGSVRKVKNRAASALAKRRWQGYTAEERREQLKKAWAGRSAQAERVKAEREGQTNDGEGAGA